MNQPKHLSRRATLKALASLGAMAACGVPTLGLATPPGLDLGLQGQDLLAAGRSAEAVKILHQAIIAAPDDPWLHGLLGRALLDTGDNTRALEAFRRASNLDPADAYSRMMVDSISSKPTAHQISMPMAQTPLQRAAQQEEEHFLAQQRQIRKSIPGAMGFQIRRVIIDPGHGGFDSGAVGSKGLREKDVALDVGMQAARVLYQAEPGLKVYVTRNDDYYLPLSARTAAANLRGADLFVSLHVNAGTRREANGVETYSCSEQASSREAERIAQVENAVLRFDQNVARAQGVDIEDLLFRFERRRYWDAGARAAKRVQRSLSKTLPLRDRGAQSAGFYVLRKSRMPSVLLETGFISNPGEERRLNQSDYRRSLALAVASAVSGLHRAGV